MIQKTEREREREREREEPFKYFKQESDRSHNVRGLLGPLCRKQKTEAQAREVVRNAVRGSCKTAMMVVWTKVLTVWAGRAGGVYVCSKDAAIGFADEFGVCEKERR